VRASLARVDLLILCPTPIGPGNVALLREALRAAQQGLPVALLTASTIDSACIPPTPIETEDGAIQRTGMAARDYTGGEGLHLMEQLLQAGARVVGSVGEALAFLEEQRA
jgi:iron complex transport system ATP-binding protein